MRPTHYETNYSHELLLSLSLKCLKQEFTRNSTTLL